MSPEDHHELEDRLRRLNEIGVSLSVERDLHALLERILLESRRFTYADAGTLYLVKEDHLTFEVTQNDTPLDFQGSGDAPPPVPLTRVSVSGYAAVTGEILNIEDVYTQDQFEGPKQYDRLTGYRTRSMLVVPMKDHENQVIGVLQLLNAMDSASRQAVAFTEEDESLIRSLASQAAVAITNVRLIRDMERLFESFVQVMATAIDERSPYTGGHIRRVAGMTMAMADAVNDCKEGPLAEVHFSEEELNELRIASWMHDIGKITTPEWVVDKPTKLTTIFDRIQLLRTRFQLIKRTIEAEELAAGREVYEAGSEISRASTEEYGIRVRELDEDLAFLERVNHGGEFMAAEDLQRLERISRRSYTERGDLPRTLTEEELYNLSIYKGSLTDEERQKINDHASLSIKMLEQIPFTRNLSQVPAIAGAHHEKLDGSGYPQGLSGDDISLQARILALVDIFESLSADDRPYRPKPMPRETVHRILREDVESGYLDRDLFDLFMRQKVYLKLDDLKADEKV